MIRALLIPCALAAGSCVFDTEPAPVLFLGNSIMNTDTMSIIGWDHLGGMAASTRENDYVHQTVALLGERGIRTQLVYGTKDCDTCNGEEITAHRVNAGWEFRSFKPRWVVVQLGENSWGDEVVDGRMAEQYRRLLQALVEAGAKRIHCLTVWNETSLSDPKNTAILAAIGNFPEARLVDITAIAQDPANYGDSTLYPHPVVQWHPGDRGMLAIAERLVEAFLDSP